MSSAFDFEKWRKSAKMPKRIIGARGKPKLLADCTLEDLRHYQSLLESRIAADAIVERELRELKKSSEVEELKRMVDL